MVKLLVLLYAELLLGRSFLINNYDKNYCITGDYPQQIKSMYDIISKFEVFEEDKEQDEILKEFREILSENITNEKRIMKLLQKYEQKYGKHNK